MRITRAIACLLVTLAIGANAAIYSSAPSAVIPDANLTGWSTTFNLPDTLPGAIQSVSVNLVLSGGFNGDLYAYLSHDGVLVPLLNRVGMGTGDSTSTLYNFGYSSLGMSVTLADGSPDIHSSGATLNGTFAPDGRTISPLSSPGLFTSPATVGFSAFNSTDPNSAWTLFLADLSGGSTSTLNSWSLDVEAVPEPVDVALGIFGGIVLVVGVYRHGRKVLSSVRRAVARV